ncbi:MAG: HD domain-containing protein [Endomicrobiia bacterium]
MNYYDIVTANNDVLVYISQADKNFAALGYTEQGLRHAKYTSNLVEKILSNLNFSSKEIDLTKTASFLHDIGCAVAYKDHEQSGAIISYKILSKLNFVKEDIFKIISLVSAHEDPELIAISDLVSSIVLADKTDVLRERVKKKDFKLFDKHDYVHYAVTKNVLDIYKDKIILELTIDTKICSVLEYFEIFMSRINFCRKACAKLGLSFNFYINEVKYL